MCLLVSTRLGFLREWWVWKEEANRFDLVGRYPDLFRAFAAYPNVRVRGCV